MEFLKVWAGILAVMVVVCVAVGLLFGAIHIALILGPWIGIPLLMLVSSGLLALAAVGR